MIHRATGEVDFQDGLHVTPYGTLQSLLAHSGIRTAIITQKLSLKGWKRHVLGFHTSEHGTFEVEALSAEEDRIRAVLLAHQHVFYEPDTPDDAERRAFHEGVISLDLPEQREFAWGEALCRLESTRNQDWLVVAYRREANVPLPVKEVILRLNAHENEPGDNV